MTTLGSESHSTTTKTAPQTQVEIECVKCDSCGFTEECTLAYISRLRNRSATSSNTVEHPIRAMGKVLRRSLDTSKRPLRSNSFASMPPLNEGLAQQSLARSESCFPSISG
ncbi:unnamed protein product [Lupinus luteus]|uniref:Uncharacterized protein n=1 Tax=Lupinus luteus TaxID=3873 RepID=A0AAV1XF95_LUPLU